MGVRGLPGRARVPRAAGTELREGLTENCGFINLFSHFLPQTCFPPSLDIFLLVLMKYFVSSCAVRSSFISFLGFFPYQSVLSELLVASIFAE